MARTPSFASQLTQQGDAEMTKTRDMSERQFESALAKFGYAPGILGMEAVVDSNGRTIIVSYVYDEKDNIKRRASLAKLHRRVDAEPDEDASGAR